MIHTKSFTVAASKGGHDGEVACPVHDVRDERRNCATWDACATIPRVWTISEVTLVWTVRMGWWRSGDEGAAGTSRRRRIRGDDHIVGPDAGGAPARRAESGVCRVDLMPADGGGRRDADGRGAQRVPSQLGTAALSRAYSLHGGERRRPCRARAPGGGRGSRRER